MSSIKNLRGEEKMSIWIGIGILAIVVWLIGIGILEPFLKRWVFKAVWEEHLGLKIEGWATEEVGALLAWLWPIGIPVYGILYLSRKLGKKLSRKLERDC